MRQNEFIIRSVITVIQFPAPGVWSILSHLSCIISFVSALLSKMFDVGDLPLLIAGNWVIKAEWLSDLTYVFLRFWHFFKIVFLSCCTRFLEHWNHLPMCELYGHWPMTTRDPEWSRHLSLNIILKYFGDSVSTNGAPNETNERERETLSLTQDVLSLAAFTASSTFSIVCPFLCCWLRLLMNFLALSSILWHTCDISKPLHSVHSNVTDRDV